MGRAPALLAGLLLAACDPAPPPPFVYAPVAASPGPAVSSQGREALRLLSEGYELYRAGRFREALNQLRSGLLASNIDDPSVGSDDWRTAELYIARSQDLLGQHHAALETYRRVIRAEWQRRGQPDDMLDRLAKQEVSRLERLFSDPTAVDARNAELFAITRYFTASETADVLRDLRTDWEGRWCWNISPGGQDPRHDQWLEINYAADGALLAMPEKGQDKAPFLAQGREMRLFTVQLASGELTLLARLEGALGVRQQADQIRAYPILRGGPQPCYWWSFGRQLTCLGNAGPPRRC